MQTKWNQFVYLLCEAKKKNVEESEYHALIEQQLQLLGWFLFNGEICHKPSVHIGNNNHIQPDILIKKDGEEEFVIEVKRPSHKLVKKDIEQHFDDAAPAEGSSAPQQKAKPKKQEKQK